MITNTFEFISVKDWCQLANSPATLFSKPRSYLALFEDAKVCLSPANWGPGKETPEGQLFYDVASTGGFAVKDLLAPLTITGSVVANLGPSIVKDDALLVLVDKHLALTESYGDERWKQYQLGAWPDAHNYPRQSIGSRLLSLFKTGKIAAPRIQRYTLEEPLIEITEPCIYLTLRAHDGNIFHWLFEVLPRLRCLDLVPQLRDLPLLVRDPLNTFQETTLRLMGITNRILTTGGKSAKVAQLYFASITSPPSIHPETVAWLRQKILGSLPSSKSVDRKLYISRKDANARRVSNEDEVMKVLAPLGFEHIVMSALSPAEQIETMRNAKTIVLAHGAAGAHLLFAPTECNVIELHSPKWPNSVYFTISKALGQPYGFLFGRHQNRQLDYSIDVKQLLSMLNATS
ncbi:glycosyltransferase family 61 protein [Polynucleobacter sp. 15G-AUS-farblos]|uniref:glycosyltransferase family 61 protein n=1 Tax=Polynucleobacter sp. 15G-AUS-farblos TaxID=2689094 RepID=UPI001C0D7032|nr:glycosyltransferase family 61 protein [Polynucleobacter sp. 15G-AUS-farblos]MBU3583732.1 glycosyltransferase family 61 protein [Polynucleobacter sp. 15G-AUS-farblos]